MRSEIAALALLAILPAAVAAQTYDLAGTVLDSATGNPIPGARIRIHTDTGEPLFATVGPDGRFQFTGLQARRYALTAWHPGYMSAAEAATGYTSESTATAPDGDVRVELVPYGAIAGTITDSLGVPVQGVPVDALQRYPIDPHRHGSIPIVDGGYQYVGRLNRPTTDDRGRFRIAPLPPGKYYVMVRATPAFGGVPRPSDPQARTTFYPHALQISAAQTVEVAAAKTTPADLQILRQAGVTVSGTIRNLSPSGLIYIGASSNIARASYTLDPASGSRFSLADLLPGTYDVEAAQFAADQQQHVPLAAARRTLEVAAQPIDGIELNLRPTVDLPVSIAFDSGCDPAPVWIQIQSDSHFTGLREFHFAPGAASVLDHLDPGKYHAYASAEPPARVYASSTEIAGVDARNTGFDVTPDTKGPLQIQMTCRR